MSTQWVVTTIEIWSFLLKKLEILVMEKPKQQVERRSAHTHTHTHNVQSAWCVLMLQGRDDTYPDKEGYGKNLVFIWNLQMVCFGWKEKIGAGSPIGGNDLSRGIKAK